MEIKGKVLHLLSVSPVQCLGNAEQGGELEHGDAAFPVLPGKMRQVSWRGFAPVSVGDLGNHVYLVPAQPEDVRVADDVAALFAKGMVVRELIRQENAEELYSTDIDSNQGAILAIQNAVVLKSQERLTRILELRSYMVSAQSSAELGRNSVSSEE